MSSATVEHADGLPLPQRYWAILTIALGLVMAVIDGAIANVALPTIARRSSRQPGLLDLDRQRLSARDHDLAAAAGVARRDHRLSPRLSGGLVLFTLRIAVLRAVAHAAAADDGAHHAGIWRGRDHERQRGAGPLHLSARSARPRHRHQRAGGRRLGRGRADGRRRHSGRRHLALAVRDQHPDRHRGAGAGLALPAAHAARQSRLRLAERGAERDHLRRRHRRDRQRRPRRGACRSTCRNSPSPLVAGVLLVRRQTHMASPLLPVDLLRIPIFALSIATSIASFCAQMLAFVALPFYLESRFGYSAVADRPADHALADRHRVRGAPGRTAGRALSGRPAGRHRAAAVRRRPRRAGAVAGRSRDRSTWSGAWR